MPTTRRQPIKTEAALAAVKVLRTAGLCKRTMLQSFIGKELGREIGDAEFEAALDQFRHFRVRGVGGFIALA